MPVLRPKTVVLRENREYVKSAFESVAVDGGSGSGEGRPAHECRICGAVLSPDRTQNLMQHLVGWPCLCRRVERRILASAAEGREDPVPVGGDGAGDKSGLIHLRRLRLSRACAAAPRCSEARAAWAEYMERSFSSLTAGTAGRSCRRCHTQILRIGNLPLLRHLAACVGIGPLVRDLEDILRTIVVSTMQQLEGGWHVQPASTAPAPASVTATIGGCPGHKASPASFSPGNRRRPSVSRAPHSCRIGQLLTS